MKCKECMGKGYKEEIMYLPVEYFGVKVLSHQVKKSVKVWCESCEGKGEVSFGEDRTGIEWERE